MATLGVTVVIEFPQGHVQIGQIVSQTASREQARGVVREDSALAKAQRRITSHDGNRDGHALTLRAAWSALLLALTAPAAVGQTAPSAAAAGQALAPLPFKGGAIAFHVRVDAAPDFMGHVTVDSAAFTGTSLAGVRGLVVVRADSMRTGIGLRDHHMRDAMETKRYSDIRFELTGVRPGATHGDTTEVTYAGRLTIHGQTRDDSIPGTVVLGAGSVEAAAAFRLDMRDYGVKPPTRFLGIVRVEPVVAITVQLSFGGPAAAK